MPAPALIVLAGLPGSGKSFVADGLAPRLGAAVFSVDPIEAAILRAGIPQSFATGLAAYEVAVALAAHQLRLGLPALGDAVNGLEVARAMWRRAAAEAGAPLVFVRVTCSDPALHRHRLEVRRRGLDGFPEPTWDDVQARRIEPWTDPVVDVDTAHPVHLDTLAARLRTLA